MILYHGSNVEIDMSRFMAIEREHGRLVQLEQYKIFYAPALYDKRPHTGDTTTATVLSYFFN